MQLMDHTHGQALVSECCRFLCFFLTSLAGPNILSSFCPPTGGESEADDLHRQHSNSNTL